MAILDLSFFVISHTCTFSNRQLIHLFTIDLLAHIVSKEV